MTTSNKRHSTRRTALLWMTTPKDEKPHIMKAKVIEKTNMLKSQSQEHPIGGMGMSGSMKTHLWWLRARWYFKTERGPGDHPPRTRMRGTVSVTSNITPYNRSESTDTRIATAPRIRSVVPSLFHASCKQPDTGLCCILCYAETLGSKLGRHDMCISSMLTSHEFCSETNYRATLDMHMTYRYTWLIPVPYR